MSALEIMIWFILAAICSTEAAKDQPAEAAPYDRAHAHHARLAGRVERTPLERRTATVGKAAADRDHFAVRGRIVVGPSEIAPPRNDLPVANDHGAEWKIGLPGFVERHAHVSFILG
jgi:hypothetical protein